MRICPSCSAKINNDSSSFCYSCGAKLNDIVEQPAIRTVIADSNPVNNPKNNKAHRFPLFSDWKVFIVGVNALSVLFFVFVLGVFFRYGLNNKSTTPQLSPLLEINSVSLENPSDFSSFKGNILKNSYYNIVSQDSESYIESSNVEQFLKKLLSDEQKKYLETTFELDFDDLLVFFKPSFAFSRDSKSAYAIVLETSGFDFFERSYSKYQNNKKQNAPIYAKRIKEFLVLSNDEKYLAEFDDVSNNIQPSLGDDSNFKNSVVECEDRSLLFIYSKNTDYLENSFSKDLEILGIKDYEEIFKKFDSKAFCVSKFENDIELLPLN